jgi:major outer membrane protein
MHQYRRMGGTGSYDTDDTSRDRRDYELYLEPTLRVSYKPTDFVKLYAAAGADYRNRVTNESEVKRWRWQPTAWAGMKVTF